MCKTIKQRVKFKAPPATVYDLLADSRKHSTVTGTKATISRKVGGTFSARVTCSLVLPEPSRSARNDALDAFVKPVLQGLPASS